LSTPKNVKLELLLLYNRKAEQRVWTFKTDHF